MTQYAEPTSTITSGGWSYTGSSLHEDTDCDGSPPTPEDTYYATINGDDLGGGTYFEVLLEEITDPGVDTDFYVDVRWRVRNASGPGEKVDVYLYEGGTLRATLWNNYNPPDDTLGTSAIGVSEADIANISDFTDLRLRIDIDTLGSGEDVDISMIFLQAPDPTGTTHNISEAESAGISDSVSRSAKYSREPSDTAGIADVAERAGKYARSESDTAGLGDAVARILKASRTQADTAGISDSVSVQLAGATLNVSAQDTAGLQTPDLSLTITAYRPLLPDTAGVSDSLSQTLASARTAVDTAGVSDDVAVSISGGKPISQADTAGLSDAVASEATYARTISDAAGIADTLSRTVLAARSVADSAGLADQVTANVSGPGTISEADTAGLSDAIAISTAHARLITETLAASESLTRTVLAARSVFDTAGISDGWDVALGTPGTVEIERSDTAGISDAVSRAATYVRLSKDTTGVSDAVSRSAGYTRGILDTGGLSDALAKAAAYARPVMDSAGLSDGVTIRKSGEGAIMNQIQKANLGADLFNGTIVV